jgi:hypothetical protein
MNFSRQKGEGKSGLIVGIAVLLIAGYVGLKVVPTMVRVYAFEDRVREECKFLHGRSMEALSNDIVSAAEIEKLEISEDNIDAKRIRVDTYEVLRVKVTYMVPIATPIKVFEWNREINYEAPIFE